MANQLSDFFEYCRDNLEARMLHKIFDLITSPENRQSVFYENGYYKAYLRCGILDLKRTDFDFDPAKGIYFELKPDFDPSKVRDALASPEGSELVLYLIYRQMRALFDIDPSPDDESVDRVAMAMKIVNTTAMFAGLCDIAFNYESDINLPYGQGRINKGALRELCEAFFDDFESRGFEFEGRNAHPWQCFGKGLDGFLNWGLDSYKVSFEPRLKPCNQVAVPQFQLLLA